MKRIITSLCAIVMAVLMLGSMGLESRAEGVSPVAENLELKTYKNVSVGGNLTAYDPDDDVVSFEITTYPVKGEIVLNDDGSFIYSPAENKKGRDYFGYKATDSMGNVSQEATVIIKIEKQRTDISYSDLKDTAAEYAAVELAEQGIFIGEKIGGKYCYYPDRDVDVGEFLAMCMMVSEEKLMDAVMTMGEDNNVPNWLKSYVCTATINGMETEYDWNREIKYSEAAAILNECLGLNDVSYITDANQLQACMNLSACGVLDANAEMEYNLTRADAALMLCRAIELVSNR